MEVGAYIVGGSRSLGLGFSVSRHGISSTIVSKPKYECNHSGKGKGVILHSKCCVENVIVTMGI